MGVLSLVAPRVGALIGIYQEHREALEGSLAAGFLPSLCAFSLSVALAGSALSFRGFFKNLRRDRTSLASLAQALPSLPSLLNPPRLQVGRDAPPIDLGGREQRDRGSPAPVSLRKQKPTRVGVGLFSMSGRQVIVTCTSTRSVGRCRSVGHTGEGHYSPAAAACLMSSRPGLSLITR